MLRTKHICVLGVVISILPAMNVSAGTNSLTAGLTVGYDYNERQFKQEGESDDVFQQISISPMLYYEYSASPLDTLGIRVEPSVKYDLEESETNWDYNDLLITFQRSLSRRWTISGSNSFLRTDNQDSDIESFDVEEGSEEEQEVESSESAVTAPALSSDAGRNRYWRNSLELGTDYTYKLDSLVHFGFGYTVLRNDSDEQAFNDYDRYVFNLSNEHFFRREWKTLADFSYIIGEYNDDESVIADPDPDDETSITPSDDLKEYRFDAALDNYSIDHNVFTVSYNYIGSKYDDVLQNDSDIHQGRLTWNQQYSEHLDFTLGAGPSYEKTKGRDANYGGNGIAALTYRLRKGSIGFELEKRYDVQNFSGTDDRGYVDLWSATVAGDYSLTRDLALSGSISYVKETREEPVDTEFEEVTEAEDVRFEDVVSDLYTARLLLSYSFRRFYIASIGYTYSVKESDLIEDEYDDHRLLLTLSWEQEWIRW